MNKVTFTILCFFMVFFVNVHSNILNDTIRSNISVMYNRVSKTDLQACRAELKVSFLPKTKMVLLYFEVPNYSFRYRNTFEDYLVIKTKDNEIKLDNLVESDPNYAENHKVVFAMAKNIFLELLPEYFSKLKFNFALDEVFNMNKLKNRKDINDGDKNWVLKIAKETSEIKVSKPDKKALTEVKLWLEKL